MRGVFSILLALFPFVAVAADTESAEIARPNLPDLTSEELADASCSEDDASCGDPEPVATGEPGSDEGSGVKYYHGNGGAYDGEPPIDIGPSSSLLDFLDDSLLDEEVLADIRENMLAGKLVANATGLQTSCPQQHPAYSLPSTSTTARVCRVGSLHPVQPKPRDETATIRLHSRRPPSTNTSSRRVSSRMPRP